MEKINSEASAKQGDCPKHSLPIEYLCVDTICHQTAQSCMLCIKDLHKDCGDEFIIEEERVAEALDLRLQEHNLQEEKKQLAKSIDSKVADFKEKIDGLLKSFDILIDGNVESIIENANALRFLKKFYRISLNDQTKLFEAKSVLNVEKEESQQIIDHLKKDMSNLHKSFVKSIEDCPLEFSIGFKSKNFMCHKNIVINKKGSGLSFSRVQGTTDFNYFSAIYLSPLKANTKIEITIDGINSGDPYLDVGIMETKKFKTFSKDPVVSFASETFSYCGTSQSGMSGSYGSAKFHSGFVFTMQFNQPAQRLSFETKDQQVKLSKDNLKKGEEYYFYLTLYHPEAACTIKNVK